MCVMCNTRTIHVYIKYIYFKNILITYYLCTSFFYLRMCTGYIYLFVFSSTDLNCHSPIFLTSLFDLTSFTFPLFFYFPPTTGLGGARTLECKIRKGCLCCGAVDQDSPEGATLASRCISFTAERPCFSTQWF